jgi:hypothetical protein
MTFDVFKPNKSKTKERLDKILILSNRSTFILLYFYTFILL